MKFIILIILFLMHSITSANECLSVKKTAGATDNWGFPTDTLDLSTIKPSSPEEELDMIYSLLSYAVVFKNWQQEKNIKQHHGKVYSQKYGDTTEKRKASYDHSHALHSRGHNFGAILVNTKNEVAHWARNNNHAQCDETQHGETRLIQQYLKRTKKSNLKGYKIFVTGDSCPMCAGMISQQKIKTAVLGLSNPFFGRNFDRMNFNTFHCKSSSGHGLKPIMRGVQPVMAKVNIRKKLDTLYRQKVIISCSPSNLYNCKKPPSQTTFLKSDEAHQLFDFATKQLFEYKLNFPDKIAKNSIKNNSELYALAISFLRKKVSLQPHIPDFHIKTKSTQFTCKQFQ